MKKIIFGAALTLTPFAAALAHGNSYIDGYYIPSADIELKQGPFRGDDSGDGFGVKGRAAFADTLFFSGEYQSVNFDDSDSDLDQVRAGLGFKGESPFFGRVEYVNFDTNDGDDSKQDGFGIHGGIQAELTPSFGITGELGYIDVDDFDGLEYLIGADLKFNPVLGAFIDYRVTNLDGDNDLQLDLNDLRVGLRFDFGVQRR